jgi:hypothetical protein
MPPVQASSGVEQSGANRLSEVGILTLAHGRPKYIGANRSFVPFVTGQAASDRGGDGFRPGFVRTANGLFDLVIPGASPDRRASSAKLELFNLTTFDTTLFIDADCR